VYRLDKLSERLRRELYVEAHPRRPLPGDRPGASGHERRELSSDNNESREIIRPCSNELGSATRMVQRSDVDLAPEASARRSTRSSPINTMVQQRGSTGPDSRPNSHVTRPATNCSTPLDHWDSVPEDQRFLAGDQIDRQPTSVCLKGPSIANWIILLIMVLC